MTLDGRSPRVLVVEDDEEIAQAVQRSLRLEWYIIGLIGLELLLSLYGLVFGGLPFATGIAR